MITRKEVMPRITLNADEITQEMAARLTIALLGQILYMKGQVPFPVTSMSRMGDRRVTENASRTVIRAEKKRFEFLESYDDLRSHLRTTFVALSTALANDETSHPTCQQSTTTHESLHSTSNPIRRNPAKIHVVFVLGPSPSAAKARYLLELDGFRVERFGEWRYPHCNRDHAGQKQCSSERDDESVGSVDSTSSSRPSSRPTTPRRSASQPLDEWDTPCSSSSSTSYDAGSVPGSPSATSSSSISVEGVSGYQADQSEKLNPSVIEQHVEEASLRTGERLLLRALFTDHEGLGFGEEISPTKAHVLIRAPRRFTHPTWVPRQSLGNVLDRQMQCFLETASRPDGIKTKKAQNHANFGVGLRTLGVRVGCRGAQQKGAEVEHLGSVNQSSEVPEDAESDVDADKSAHEGDELIWWSWDGKLIGFAD